MGLPTGCLASAVIGEFMLAAKSKSARELFYERWKAAVFKFWLLVTPTESRAEERTARVFKTDRLYSVPHYAIFSFVYRMVEDEASAEKLTEEILLRWCRATRPDLVEMASTIEFYRIARAVLLQRMTEEGENPGNFDAGRRIEAIRKSIRRLPEEQRVAIILHKYQHLSVSEISQVLEMSGSDAQTLLFQAYDVVRSELIDLIQL